MLAYRRTWFIKQGRMEDALELAQTAIDFFKARDLEGRVYSSRVGPQDVLVWEEDWESTEEHDKFWAEGAEVQTAPEAVSFWERWPDVTERGGTQEIWNLKTSR